MVNTKERHQEILHAANVVLEAFNGVETIDAMPEEERKINLRKMAIDVVGLTDCAANTARSNIAKALRRARYGVMIDRWGGSRESDQQGRPRLPDNQKRERVSTRLAPGYKELAQAIAEIEELPGWGHSLELALTRLVEGDRELIGKLAEIGIIIRQKEST